MRRHSSRRSAALTSLGTVAVLCLVAGCSGSKGGSATPTPTPTPTPTASASPTVEASATPPAVVEGVSTAVPLPGDVTAGFGSQTAIAMGGAGAPVVAYVWEDPAGDDSANSDELYTSAYDPVTKGWGTPAKLAIGDFEGRFGTDISIGGDPATGVVAVAYSTGTVDGTSGIDLALSADGGQTWASSTVSSDAGASHPSVAVGGGKIYVAYPVQSDGLHLATSDGTVDPTFTDATLPGDGDAFPTANEQPAVAVAPDGSPMVAYETDTGTDYDRELLTWTPGAEQPVKVLDSAGYQNDGASVALAFQGSTAIALDSLVRDGSDPNVGYLATSTDGGRTWSPDNGAAVPAVQAVSAPFGYALAAGKAETVLAFYPNSGGDRTCAGVVLAGTTDLESWQSCDLFSGAFPNVSEQRYPGATTDTDGSVWVVFANLDTDDAGEPTGVLVWNDGGEAVAGLAG